MTSDPYAPLVELYRLEHDPFDDDHALYATLADQVDGTIVEVGCGTGRISNALARAGFEVIGVDPSPAMLDVARREASGLDNVRYLDGDAGSLPGDVAIGLAIFALDTFGHLLESDDQIAALSHLRKRMGAQSRLVIDLSVPDPATWLREDSLLIHAWTRELGDEHVQKLVARTVDELEQIQTLRLVYDRWTDNSTVRRVGSELRLRYFFPSELKLLLAAAGFEPVEWMGDYNLSPLDETSGRIIVVARPSRRRGRAQ